MQFERANCTWSKTDISSARRPPTSHRSIPQRTTGQGAAAETHPEPPAKEPPLAVPLAGGSHLALLEAGSGRRRSPRLYFTSGGVRFEEDKRWGTTPSQLSAPQIS